MVTGIEDTQKREKCESPPDWNCANYNLILRVFRYLIRLYHLDFGAGSYL